MNKLTLLLCSVFMAGPAFSQTMYKCPDAAGVVKFQQMPCTPQGGGETVEKREIKTTGSSMMSENAKAYLADVDAQRAEQAKIDDEEAKRQEQLSVERHKANAAYEQAAAQRATARAILLQGR